ncbi:MAG: CobW family GTP-binding protein [Betaproteobacteria bacterium]
MASSAIPVFLLTGFLGSGKTTLLKALLAHPDMRDTVVVVNELGEVGLDHILVREVTEEVVLLSSGCICCSMRDDLVSALHDLASLRHAGSVPPYARAVVETTGLADPAPLVQTLIGERSLRDDWRLASLVATVDALLGSGELDVHPESVKQAAIADRLVITKTDLASAAQLDQLRERLRILNPAAAMLSSSPGRHPLPHQLLDAGFDVRSKAEAMRIWLSDDAYPVAGEGPGRRAMRGHDERVASFCLRIAQPVEPSAFFEWLELLLASRGENLLRVKGLVHLTGHPRPVVVHGVQHMFYPPAELEGWPDQDRTTRIVFITRDLTRAAVETSLRQVLGPAVGVF